MVDVVMIGHGVPEDSVTEMTQAALLLISAALFGCSAWREPGTRGFFVLVAGFFLCMLVRELDEFLDEVWHGFWLVPALGVAILTIALVLVLWRDSVLRPMAEFIDTKPYFHLLFGLIVVLVFSRIFGSGSLMWERIMGPDYTRISKAALQEGLELFGYVFIAYGSWLNLWRGRQASAEGSSRQNLPVEDTDLQRVRIAQKPEGGARPLPNTASHRRRRQTTESEPVCQ